MPHTLSCAALLWSQRRARVGGGPGGAPPLLPGGRGTAGEAEGPSLLRPSSTCGLPSTGGSPAGCAEAGGEVADRSASHASPIAHSLGCPRDPWMSDQEEEREEGRAEVASLRWQAADAGAGHLLTRALEGVVGAQVRSPFSY